MRLILVFWRESSIQIGRCLVQQDTLLGLPSMLFEGEAQVLGFNTLKGESSYLGQCMGIGDLAAGIDHAVPRKGCFLREFRQ